MSHADQSLTSGKKSTETLSPIEGFDEQPLMPLEDAVKPLMDIVPDLDTYVKKAKDNFESKTDDLTVDELAAIWLYTKSWINKDESIYMQLNRTLRAAVREDCIP
ncbi:unnamed protein product, partial [Rotaria sp. Silwood1]